ncbi:hypothetical protein K2Y11_08795 [bacterium]|nr:hypothetical protein [bacterium]
MGMFKAIDLDRFASQFQDDHEVTEVFDLVILRGSKHHLQGLTAFFKTNTQQLTAQVFSALPMRRTHALQPRRQCGIDPSRGLVRYP